MEQSAQRQVSETLTNYLQEVDAGVQQTGITTASSGNKTRVLVKSYPNFIGVTLQLVSGDFEAASDLTPAEARLVAEALLMAARDAAIEGEWNIDCGEFAA